MLILSPSGLAVTQRCTRAGWYRYICGLREREPMVAGSAALAGSYAHAAFEFLHEHPTARTIEVRTHLLQKQWPSPDMVPQAVAQARAAKIELERVFPHYEFLGAEIELTAPVRDDVALGGRMDLAIKHGGRVIIVDLKTSTKSLKIWNHTQFNPQLLHYAAGWWLLNDVVPRTGLLRVDRHCKAHWCEAETTLAAIDAHINTVMDVAQRLRGPGCQSRTLADRGCYHYNKACEFMDRCMAALHGHATSD